MYDVTHVEHIHKNNMDRLIHYFIERDRMTTINKAERKHESASVPSQVLILLCLKGKDHFICTYLSGY